MEKANKRRPILRRQKRNPMADLLHTLAVGIPLSVLLFAVLPSVFHFVFD